MIINIVAFVLGIFCIAKIIMKCNYSKKAVFSIFMIILAELYFIFKSLMYFYVRNKNSSVDISFKLSEYFGIYRDVFELFIFAFIVVMAIINIKNFISIRKNNKD